MDDHPMETPMPTCPSPDCPNPPEMLCRSGRCADHCLTDCPVSCPGEPDDPPDTDLYDPGPIIVEGAD